MASVEMKTIVKGNGYRRTTDIPSAEIDCQYYKQVEVGDVLWGGHVVTQEDIDNGHARLVGFNCGSPVVDWMNDGPDGYVGQYYLTNPFEEGGIGEDGELFDHSPGGCGTGCNVNGMGTCEECVGSGITPPADEDFDGVEDCIQNGFGGTCWDGVTCWNTLDSIPFDCPPQWPFGDDPGTGYGEEQGGAGGNQPFTRYKCCDAGEPGVEEHFAINGMGISPTEDPNRYDLEACNLYQCVENSITEGPVDSQKHYRHRPSECFHPVKDWNVVWQYSDYRNWTAEPGNIGAGDDFETQRHFPFYNKNHISGSGESPYMKYYTGNLQGNTKSYAADIPLNFQKSRYQTNEYYDVAVRQTIVSCEEAERVQAGLYSPYRAEQLGELVGCHSLEPGHPCIQLCVNPNILTDNMLIFLQSTFGKFYMQQFFATTDVDILRQNPENTYTSIPSEFDGYGLSWWIDSPESEGIFEGTFDWGSYGGSQGVVMKDVLYRLGFPHPPVAIGKDHLKNPDIDFNGPPHCENAEFLYLQAIYDWRGTIGIGAFFDDFTLPGLNNGEDGTGLIEPTMNSVLDPFSALDYRSDVHHKGNLRPCSYFEFMTLPGGITNGDGIFYRPQEIPLEYLQRQENSDYFAQIQNIECDTPLSILDGLIFSKVKVTCNDGSQFIVMEGDGNTEGLDGRYAYSGDNMCAYNIKNRSTQDLYYLSNADKRIPLGIFYPDSINIAKDNFSSNLSSEYSQLAKPNRITNGRGQFVDETVVDEWQQAGITISDSQHWQSIGVLPSDTFTPENWRPQTRANESDAPTSKVMPYWAFNDESCYSQNRCLIFDYGNHSQIGNDGYDSRQGWKYKIRRNTLASSYEYGQSYKVSFLMKTNGINKNSLHNTGMHVVFNLFDNPNNVLNFIPPSTGGDRNPFEGDLDNPSTVTVVENSNSQCGEMGHTFFVDSSGGGYFSKNSNHYDGFNEHDDNLYCKQSRASFSNTKVGEWERMEFTFQIHPFYKYLASILGYPDPDLGIPERKDASLPMSIQFYDLNYAKGGFSTDGHFKEQLDNNRSRATIYIDEVELKESYDFHPDVVVRKRKSSTEFGTGELTRYFDPEILEQQEAYNDTSAPLEVACYFYPRYAHDDIFSPKKNPMVQELKYGQFFITDLDWGDGSPIQYTSSPLMLGFNTMPRHTYIKPGMYEIKGTMFQIKPDVYTWDLIPENILYDGIGGVASNRRFSLRINVNEGRNISEDFPYLGADGFKFIPFQSPTPIIGGWSTQSSYFKNIKRNLGMMGVDYDVDNYVDINYGNIGDRYYTELAMWKMYSSYVDFFKIFPEYLIPRNPQTNVEDRFLETLPFPSYLEEFSSPEGNVDLIDETDANWWGDAGRRDIKDYMLNNIINAQSEDDLPINGGRTVVTPYAFINPTFDEVLLTAADGTYSTGDERFNKVKDGLGSSIGDVDLSHIRYYNSRLTLFDMLGFEEQEETTEQFVDSFNITPEYLATLPFPTSLSEFDIYNTGIGVETSLHWGNEGRPDIAMMIQQLLLYPDNVDDFYESLNNANEDSGYTFPTNIQLPLSDEGYSVGEIAIHYTGNTMTGYFGAGPITDINNFIGGEEFFPLPIGINTYACAEVFGGDGTPGADNGYKFSTESLSTIVDEEGRNYDVYECIPGNLLVLPSSSYFNLSSYTFNSNHPQNPSSPRYWKNYISKDYSIFNRQGINLDLNLIDIYSQQRWLDNSYYPVLPRHGADGRFLEDDYPDNNIPFPLNGPITENKHEEASLIIEITNEELDVNVFDDKSGNQNYGHGVSDFKPKFEDTTLEPKITRKMSKIKTSTLTKAF